MIIREYEYEKERPWNCQERFLQFRDYDDPWQEYKDNLFGKPPNTLSMNDLLYIDTIREDEKENALSFEFGIKGYTYIHVAQEWTKQFNREPIVVKIGKGGKTDE